MNPTKCNLYYGGMDRETEHNITILTGFSVGSLPFRYLGIPVTRKRLSNSECTSLVEKICSHIRHWSVHYLSYAGRIQLINSILFGITNYWL